MRTKKQTKKQAEFWISRWMAPLYGRNPSIEDHGCPEPVLAPDLMTAFKIIRALHPTASGWVCLGHQDPDDPERILDDPFERSRESAREVCPA